MHRRILAATATLAVLAVPATAVGADTTVSFEVTAAAGGLSISQAAATADLGTEEFSAGAGSISGTLPETTVTDVRGTLLAGWTVTVSSAAPFENGDGDTIPLSNVHVYNDVASVGALTTALGGVLSGMTLSGGEFNVGANDLSSPYTLLSGVSTLGNGSVDFTATVDVTIPAATPIGTYETVISQTVS